MVTVLRPGGNESSSRWGNESSAPGETAPGETSRTRRTRRTRRTLRTSGRYVLRTRSWRRGVLRTRSWRHSRYVLLRTRSWRHGCCVLRTRSRRRGRYVLRTRCHGGRGTACGGRSSVGNDVPGPRSPRYAGLHSPLSTKPTLSKPRLQSRRVSELRGGPEKPGFRGTKMLGTPHVSWAPRGRAETAGVVNFVRDELDEKVFGSVRIICGEGGGSCSGGCTVF